MNAATTPSPMTLDRELLRQLVEVARSMLGSATLWHDHALPVHVGAARRVKLKPNRKVTAEFHVRTAMGGEHVVAWTWPSTAVTLDESALSFAADDLARRGVPTPFRRYWFEVAGGVARAEPLDPSIPGLANFVDPVEGPALVDRSTGCVPTGAAITVRYRPRQRHVLRFPARPTAVFVKLSGRALRGASAADAASGSLADGALRPVVAAGRFPDLAAALYTEVDGLPLDQLPDDALLDALGHAAAGLAMLPAVALPDLELPAPSPYDHCAAISRASQHLAPLALPAAERFAGLLTLAERVAPDATPAFAHGDLKLEHLWARADGRIGLADWDTSCRADPASDLGKLLADVWWSRPHLRDRVGALLPTTDPRDEAQAWWEATWTLKAAARRADPLAEDFVDRVQGAAERAAALLAGRT
jgi:phosphotransferase family enzyme